MGYSLQGRKESDTTERVHFTSWQLSPYDTLSSPVGVFYHQPSLSRRIICFSLLYT